jgi:hypothetical protein
MANRTGGGTVTEKDVMAGADDVGAAVARDPFYGPAVGTAKQELLTTARTIEGLEEEIALLRVRLFEAVQKKPADLQLLLRGVNALTRAVAAQYRLSPKARRDLADHLANVLNALGDQFGLPEG